jgi:hypothetical protein
MFNIRFFSRVTFICNICFLLAFVLQMIPHPPEGEMVATTIIIGYVLAVIINLTVSLWLIILFFSGRKLKNLVPLWLIIINFLFLIPDLILFFKCFPEIHQAIFLEQCFLHHIVIHEIIITDMNVFFFNNGEA